MVSSALVKSPEVGPHADTLLLSFGSDEIEALRKLDAAAAELDELVDAVSEPGAAAVDRAWQMVFGISDFYRSRLMRLAPDRADLIEWVFDANTLPQGEAAVRGLA